MRCLLLGLALAAPVNLPVTPALKTHLRTAFLKLHAHEKRALVKGPLVGGVYHHIGDTGGEVCAVRPVAGAEGLAAPAEPQELLGRPLEGGPTRSLR